MRIAVGLFVFALCISLTTNAQIVPNGGCGCGLSSSTVACNCAGALSKSKQSVPSDRPQLIETLFTFSLGALLTKGVLCDDELFIGMGIGKLTNEAKSPPVDVSIGEGTIFLMPRNEPYKLRNVGLQDVKVRVIRIHRSSAACQTVE